MTPYCFIFFWPENTTGVWQIPFFWISIHMIIFVLTSLWCYHDYHDLELDCLDIALCCRHPPPATACCRYVANVAGHRHPATGICLSLISTHKYILNTNFHTSIESITLYNFAFSTNPLLFMVFTH